MQRTTRARVGLRGRELQTIARLRDNVIVFFFRGKRTNEREERAMMSSHCCAAHDEFRSKETFALLIKANIVTDYKYFKNVILETIERPLLFF